METIEINKEMLKEWCTKYMCEYTDWTGTRLETTFKCDNSDYFVKKLWSFLEEKSEDAKQTINNDYDKGFQDAVKKTKRIILSSIPLPSHKNHNIIYDMKSLEERDKYAHQVAEKYEEKMNQVERGIIK